MPIKDVCSPNSSGKQAKPQPLPGSNKSRGVKHAAVYDDGARNDQVQPPPFRPSLSSTPRSVSGG
jgi:hypothetical protein